MIHQLLYGYDDGHRLLRGSTNLSSQANLRLLGATDADPGAEATMLVTGIPLPSEQFYALCFTWRAPEMVRPGSVWGHVLLLSPSHLLADESPYRFAALARRPAREALHVYDTPIDEPLFEDDRIPVSGVFEAVAAATLGPGYGRVAMVGDLDEAARSFGYIWGLQWPALRARFAFRTRDVGRLTQDKAVVAVRKVQGQRRPLEDRYEFEALAVVVHDMLTDGAGLHNFLSVFGPQTAPTMRNFGILATIHAAYMRERYTEARQTVEEHFPTPDQAAVLKFELFGPSRYRPSAENAIVRSLLGARVDAWNVDDLHLAERLQVWLRAHDVQALLSELSVTPPRATEEILAAHFAREGTLPELLQLLEGRRTLFDGVLRRSPRFLHFPEAWARLSLSDSERLLAALELSIGVLEAAVLGHKAEAAIAAYGHAEPLGLLSSVRNFDLARRLLLEVPLRADDWLMLPARVVLFAAASTPEALAARSAQTTVREALIIESVNRDDIWLRAAASLLKSRRAAPDESLLETFGHLHRAMTENRLPSAAWRQLDAILPPGNDPSRRLRQYLLRVGERNGWGKEQIEQALAAAGPFINPHLWGADKSNEWFNKTLKVVLEALGYSSSEKQ